VPLVSSARDGRKVYSNVCVALTPDLTSNTRPMTGCDENNFKSIESMGGTSRFFEFESRTAWDWLGLVKDRSGRVEVGKFALSTDLESIKKRSLILA
jgi:hypothetical protein